MQVTRRAERSHANCVQLNAIIRGANANGDSTEVLFYRFLSPQYATNVPSNRNTAKHGPGVVRQRSTRDPFCNLPLQYANRKNR